MLCVVLRLLCVHAARCAWGVYLEQDEEKLWLTDEAEARNHISLELETSNNSLVRLRFARPLARPRARPFPGTHTPRPAPPRMRTQSPSPHEREHTEGQLQPAATR
jgi:hypothetical protein